MSCGYLDGLVGWEVALHFELEVKFIVDQVGGEVRPPFFGYLDATAG